ncbi:MAG: GntR family transcriptional regulator [Hyphomicrobiaceae bacterium]
MTVTRQFENDDFDGTSRAEFAYRMLLDAIRDQTLKPGARVREDEMSRLLGISRTPVRQALHKLQTRGLLRQAPGRGLLVAELDRQQVVELYAMRELLEGAAARLAAQHAGPSDIVAMWCVLQEFNRAAPNPRRLARINRVFHSTVHEAAHNRYLSQSLDDFNDTLALLRGTTFSLKGRWNVELAENSELVDAIERRDAEAAEAAARQNMRNALDARLRMLFAA